MGSWLSLVFSIVIGGMVMLSFGRFSGDVNRDSYMDLIENAAYGNLDDVVRIIEYDFSRIGLGMNDPSQTIMVTAAASDIQFYLDSNGDGVLETLRYYLSDTTDALVTSTPNPSDRVLYRVVNGGTPERISSGLTGFAVAYYGQDGAVTATLGLIRSFSVSITMESEVAYDDDYPKMAWQGRITPTAMIMR